MSPISEETKLRNGCKRIAGGRNGERESGGTSRHSPSPRGCGGSRYTSAGDRGVGLESTGSGTASGGRVGPLVGFATIDGRLIIVDRRHGRGRRRALGPVP